MVEYQRLPVATGVVFRAHRLRVIWFSCSLAVGLLAAGVTYAADWDLGNPSTRNLPANLPTSLFKKARGAQNGELVTDSVTDSVSDSAEETDGDSYSNSSAQALFVSSGLKELVGQIPLSTASSFEAALTSQQLPDLFMAVDQSAVGEAVHNAFKVETFNKYLVQELDNGMSQSAREYILAWYASPLGGRVKQAELDNSLLTEQTRFDNYQVFLRHYPADVVREALIEKLDITMKSTESAMEMMGSIQVAFNLSLTRFMPEEHRLSRHEILEMVRQSQDELLTHYEKKTKDVLLFTYQSLNNDDLSLLNDKLATDAGQEFVIAINRGIKKGMFAASLDLGDGLGALLDALPENSGI